MAKEANIPYCIYSVEHKGYLYKLSVGHPKTSNFDLEILDPKLQACSMLVLKIGK